MSTSEPPLRFTSDNLTGITAGSLAGATVRLRFSSYQHSSPAVKDNDNDGTIEVEPASYQTSASPGFGFYLDGLKSFIDVDGEWAIERVAGEASAGAAVEADVYLQWPHDPSALDVRLTVHDGISLQAPCNGSSVKNVKLEQFLVQGVQAGVCDGVTIENVTMASTGWFGVNMSRNATNPTIRSVAVDKAQAIGVLMEGTGLKMTGSNVTNVSMVEGYGVPAGLGASAIGISSGEYSDISGCRVERIGYHGISMGSHSSYRMNFISHVVERGNDGGGFYQWSNAPPYDGGNLTIEDNIVLYALGNTTLMPPSGQSFQWGRNIYTDDRIHDVVVSGNTLAYSGNLCLFVHGGYNITAQDNVMFDCKNAGFGLQDEVDEPVRHTLLRSNGMFTFGDATDPNGSPLPLQMTSANNLSNFDFGAEEGNLFYSPHSNGLIARRRIVDFRYPYRGPIAQYDGVQWSHSWEHGDPLARVAPPGVSRIAGSFSGLGPELLADGLFSSPSVASSWHCGVTGTRGCSVTYVNASTTGRGMSAGEFSVGYGMIDLYAYSAPLLLQGSGPGEEIGAVAEKSWTWNATEQVLINGTFEANVRPPPNAASQTWRLELF